MSSLMPGEFKQWADRHASVFGMLSVGERLMLDQWLDIFVGCDYTIAELRYATEMLARNPPKFRTEHLPLIHSTIGALRRKRQYEDQESLESIEAFERCKRCLGTGWASVPHPRYLVDGVWIAGPGSKWKPLAHVTCTCDAGRRVASAHTKKHPLSLEHYEERNPDWKTQLDEHQAAVSAERKAKDHAIAADRSLGRLVSDLASQLGYRTGKALATTEVEKLERDAIDSRSRGPKKQLKLFDESPADGAGSEAAELPF